MRGRKPKPVELKVINGEKRPSRLNPNSPDPERKVPKAPRYLNARAREEWDRITEELGRLNMLCELDRTELASYCICQARHMEAEELLEKTGLLDTDADGRAIKNPLVEISSKHMELAHKFLIEFGMTPSSRARVKVPKKDDGKNKWTLTG